MSPGRPVTGPRAARRATGLVIAAASVLALLVVGFVAIDALRSYRGALAIGAVRAGNLVHVLEEQTRRTVQAVDLSLLSIAEQIADGPPVTSHDPRFTARLRERLAGLPYVRAIFVIGADGFIIQDTDADTPRRNLADRDYFRSHAENPQSGLFIGPPLVSRSPGAPWFLSMSRRITRPDGSFLGVAVAAVEPLYFARFYASIRGGSGGSVTLLYRNGAVIARYPDHEGAIGSSFADRPLFTTLVPQATSGTFTSESSIDDTERVFSYRVVEPHPLVVAVGLSTAELLRDWRQSVFGAAIMTALWVLLLAAATAWILRQRARDALAAERLHRIEKAEALGRLTGTVAHDFNNLLTVVRGNLEIIAAALPPEPPLQQRVAKALGAVERGASLIGRLMSVTRRPARRTTTENLAGIVHAAADLLQHAAAPAVLEFDCAADTGACAIDRAEFERALLNLIVNARDAMPDGGTVRVRTFNVAERQLDRSAWPELARRDYVGCSVGDDGEGMPAQVLARLGEPFFTTKPEGAGTGLGIAQVFGFAQQSGGGIRVESTVGSGTLVTILLPRIATPATATVRDGKEPAPA